MSGSARHCRDHVPVPEDVRRRISEVCGRYRTMRDASLALGISVDHLSDLRSPNGLVRQSVLERVKRKLVLLLGAAAMLSCESTRARFARDIAVCELQPTCAEAVECRREVARAYGRDADSTVGHCEDGGAP
jgi:CRP-like cAMP-binding protein